MSYKWVSGNYVTQLALDVDPTYSMAIRHKDFSGVWKDWKKVITEVNIGDYEARSAKYISNSGAGYAGTSQSLTTGWVRIGSTLNADSGGNTITLYLKRNYSYTNNENYIFQICNVYSGNTTITQVAGYANSRVIDQIRVTGNANSGPMYIDIHINVSSTSNYYTWTIVGDATAQSVWTVNPSAGAVTTTFYTVQGFSTSNILKGNYLSFRNYNNDSDAGCVGRGSGGNNQIYLASYNNNNVIIDAGSGVVTIPTSKFGIGVIPTSSYKLQVAGDIHATNWIRTSGSNGWYSETYGGGIYMTDTNYVKVYNNKSFQVTSGTYYAVYIGSGGIYSYGKAGSSWLSGYGIVNAVIPNNSSQTPLWVCARNDGSLTAAGADRIFAIELYNTGTLLRFAFGNAERFDFYNNGVFNAAGGITTAGNITASGEITAYSDIRLKSNVSDLSYRGRLKPKSYIKDSKRSIGFIALDVLQLYPELVMIGQDENHYLSLNYGNITAVLSVLLNLVEDRVLYLENRVSKLENTIVNLGGKVPS